jgi:putative Holliday junction resolvase
MSVNVFIGFDFGTKKIGVAIAQTITNTATPMPAIKMINGQPKWNDLDEIISDFKPKKAIIGIPDSENKQTKKLITKIKIFSSALEKKYTIPTILINEGFSTQMAKQELKDKRQSGVLKNRIKKGQTDSTAAKIILEQWLKLNDIES